MGDVDYSESERSQAAGFRDVITKPFDLDTLVRQVKVLLANLPENGTSDPPQGDATWPLASERASADPLRVS